MITVNSRLPIFNLQTAEGRPTTLQANLGPRATLAVFLHRTWCADCAAELYSLQRRHRAFTAAGGTVLAVTQDTAAGLAAFIASSPIRFAYRLLADPEGASQAALGGPATAALVADARGMVRWLTGWDDDRARPGPQALLAALLASGAPAVRPAADWQ
ncbi:MAG: redoxin domain-containing protein [Anaerolineales bacterium]|nr:redoxin domain-containing protein [Anaerolineales bacterium]